MDQKLDQPVKVTAGTTDNFVYRVKYGRAEVCRAIMQLYFGMATAGWRRYGLSAAPQWGLATGTQVCRAWASVDTGNGLRRLWWIRIWRVRRMGYGATVGTAVTVDKAGTAAMAVRRLSRLH
jgi:hypothetical protein